MSRIVPATETAIDPAHPRRLEKKTNIFKSLVPQSLAL